MADVLPSNIKPNPSNFLALPKSLAPRRPSLEAACSAAVVATHTLLAMLSAAAFLGSAVPSTVEVCPGEGPRYGDFKCNHDGTHRVCAQLVDNVTHAPLKWGTGDFWDLTGQKAFQWSDKIVAAPNPGDSWCICMWATASLIKQAGCDNVHLRCDSTDVAYVLNQ